MAAPADIINEYLKSTGQTRQELFSGAGQYGAGFVLDLAEKAFKNKQKIIWYDHPNADPTLGLLLYRLESL